VKSSYGGIVVNHTSLASVATVPFQGVYTASKAAIAMLSDTLRLELGALGVTVVDIKSGIVLSNLIKNGRDAKTPQLPDTSFYKPARDVVEKALSQENFVGVGSPAPVWAKAVVRDLLKKKPRTIIYKGKQAWLAWVIGFLPSGALDGTVKKLSGLDVVENIMKVGQ
jgi:1-acylglycerone phosphate reductase